MNLKPNTESGIKWNKSVFTKCCDIIEPKYPDLSIYGKNYIEHGADMRRHTIPPSKEEPPYPIKDGPLKELASKKFLELYDEKRFEGPYDERPEGVFLSPILLRRKISLVTKFLY